MCRGAEPRTVRYAVTTTGLAEPAAMTSVIDRSDSATSSPRLAR